MGKPYSEDVLILRWSSFLGFAVPMIVSVTDKGKSLFLFYGIHVPLRFILCTKATITSQKYNKSCTRNISVSKQPFITFRLSNFFMLYLRLSIYYSIVQIVVDQKLAFQDQSSNLFWKALEADANPVGT